MLSNMYHRKVAKELNAVHAYFCIACLYDSSWLVYSMMSRMPYWLRGIELGLLGYSNLRRGRDK